MNVMFRDPYGKEHQATESALRRRILTDGEEYWTVGSGEGCIEALDFQPVRTMVLSLKEPFGFFVRYGEYDSTDDRVAVGSSDYTKTTEVVVGGNPWMVPTGFFITREMAWKAVSDFISSGEMSTSLVWKRLDEQTW